MRLNDAYVPRILIADDQPDVLEALRFLIKGEGYQAEAVNSPAGILEAVESRDFDAVVMDLNYTRDTTSGQEGLDLLNRLQALDSSLPVIVMTAWGSVDLAVEAMRRGARDFIQKPWDNARLSAILGTQIELGRALRKGQILEAENRLLRAEQFPSLIAQSAAMQPVLDMISRVGPSDANVLITGENGTGKGLVAQSLHSVSLRAVKPMLTVNTGGPFRRRIRKRTVRPCEGSVYGRQSRTAWAASKWPKAVLCFWTRSPTSRRTCRPSCCACWRPANSSAWDRPRRAKWTCGCSRPPIRT